MRSDGTDRGKSGSADSGGINGSWGINNDSRGSCDSGTWTCTLLGFNWIND